MLKNMEYIYAVYQKKSFSKAAEALYISQPALSTAIRKIEAEIQLPLFDRSSAPIELTEAGKYYIDSIEKVMAIERDMSRRFSEMLRERQTIINLGSASYFCAHILPPLINAFRVEHPDVAVNLLEANSSEFAGLFQSDVLDICLSVDQLQAENRRQALNSVVWRQEKIIAAVPAGFPMSNELKQRRLTFDQVRAGENAGGEAIDLSLLRDMPFLLLKPGNDLCDRALQMCKNAGFQPNVSMYLDQLLTSYYVACSGKGAAFIRAELIQYVEPTAQLIFFQIDDPLSVRDVRLYHKKSQALTAIAREFLDFLIKYGDQNEN